MVPTNPEWRTTPEEQFHSISNKLYPTVARVGGVTKTEATSMITIVFTAMFQQLLEKGHVKLPWGNMVMSTRPREKYPLRIKLYMETPQACFLSTGESITPTPIMMMLLPEHYELLAKFQELAYKDKRIKSDNIQASNSTEL